LAEIIREGTPRMPGFKFQFGADQIGAIVAYLRTVPAQQASPQTSSQPQPAGPASGGARARQQREAD
jgi:mono/diheme cytochrome c family protein